MAGAIARSLRGLAPAHAERAHIGFEQRLLLVEISLVHLPDLDDLPHHFHVEAVALGLGIDVADIVGERLLFFFEALDPFDERFQVLSGDPARLRHETLRFCDGAPTLSKSQSAINAPRRNPCGWMRARKRQCLCAAAVTGLVGSFWYFA